MHKYSVPYNTHTRDVYEVEAKGPSQAVMVAEELRRNGVAPTHTHTVKFDVGAVKQTIADPIAEAIAAGSTDD